VGGCGTDGVEERVEVPCSPGGAGEGAERLAGAAGDEGRGLGGRRVERDCERGLDVVGVGRLRSQRRLASSVVGEVVRPARRFELGLELCAVVLDREVVPASDFGVGEVPPRVEVVLRVV